MAKAPTIITASTTVDGRVEGSEDVEIYGAVRGAIRLVGALYLDGEARVDAEVEVTSVAIHGILVGNVQASDSIEIFGSARVVGDLTAPRVVLHDGALYRGTIDMGEAPDEGADRGTRGASRPAPARSAPARPAPSRPAPPPARPAPPPRKEAPPPEPAVEDEDGEDDDDEPALPDAAGKKKVQVKKRK